MMTMKVPINHISNYIGIRTLERFTTNRDKQETANSKQQTYFSTPGRSGKASVEESFSKAFNYEKNHA
jgi:hypothetical protein